MSDDPWAQYLKPPSAAPSSAASPSASSPSDTDPWSQYVKPGGKQAPAPSPAPAPAPAAANPTSAGAPSGDFSTAGSSLGDFLSGLVEMPKFNPPKSVGEALMRAQEGASKIAATGRVAANALGAYDPIAAAAETAVGSGSFKENLAAEQAKTEQARKQAGGYAPAGEILGGMPVGELGLGVRAGEAVASPLTRVLGQRVGNYLGGIAGLGAEGSATSAASAFGHGEDPWQAAKWGFVGGGAAGALGGAVGRGAAAPIMNTASGLKAAAQQEYQPLHAAAYDMTNQVAPKLDAVVQGMSPYEQTLASSTMNEINRLKGQGTIVSGADLQAARQQLGDVMGAPSASAKDKFFAPKFQSALDEVLNNTQPAGIMSRTPGQGMTFMPNPTLGSGGMTANDVSQALKRGNDLWGRGRALENIAEWEKNTAVPGGPGLNTQASQWLRSPEGQRFAPPGSPLYDATSALAKQPGAPNVSGMPSTWDVRHALAPVIEGAVTGLAAQSAEGHFDPYTLVPEVLGGAAAGYALHKGVPWVHGKFAGPAQQRALAALKATAGSGTLQQPQLPAARVRDLLRQLYFGTIPARTGLMATP